MKISQSRMWRITIAITNNNGIYKTLLAKNVIVSYEQDEGWVMGQGG